jgi:2-(1,2-epoxy-1,2-dihydrophenyl)acetyl-CoA isomerase
MAYEALLYDVSDHIATITLSRPERLNALSPQMREELHDAITTSNDNDHVRVIVITGAGRGFCSGGDVKAMNERNESGAGTALEEAMVPARDAAVLAMRDSRVPIIAAVNGAAAGAGMNIALACDIRIAADNAKFGQTFTRRGLHPDWGGTYFLPRLVGMAKACELIFTGKMIDAAEALRLGIVTEVTRLEDLMPTVRALAAEIAAGPPIAIRLARRAMYRNADSNLREALEYETFAQNLCRETEDSKEGVRAFVEKREPQFSGR